MDRAEYILGLIESDPAELQDAFPAAVEWVKKHAQGQAARFEARAARGLEVLAAYRAERDPIAKAYRTLHAAKDPGSFATALAELRRLQSVEATQLAKHIDQHTPFNPARATDVLAHADELIAQYEDPSRDDKSS